ncbi:O-antigen ligase family protein [Spirosoma endophyticum]|uniref:O-antigen ligase n=1 Tax=Spirosoma endophyticum TaxID=662367 RepID=A0A1I2C9W2_9BACT|nr:O-antigen ligase family protein [Spirosoma endophyticum]SFE65121.1 O-antigen ligase [Spirosoma endophyticum]
MIWIYRIALYALLFGVSAIAYGGNAGSPFIEKAVNGLTLVGILALVGFYFKYPVLYKIAAWMLFLGVILLLLESKYEYNQYVYSYFVIKRFAFCGLALLAYYVVERAEPLKFSYVVYIIFGLYLINQILLGQLFSYALTAETRTTAAPDALYLVIPFVYYLVNYLKEHAISDLLKSLFTFAFIVFLLHRSVMTAAVVAAAVVIGLTAIGKLASANLPLGRTLIMLVVLVIIAMPLAGSLPGKKMEAFAESIGGIFDPKEDETGSWRIEQSEFYLSQIPARPLFGWRYAGYDRGEIMGNDEFPDKGTFIHSQYVDMLYNYGAVGLGINLLLIIGTLITIYRRNHKFTTEHAVLFSFIICGIVYGVSYQLPLYYWTVVGIGMFYGLKRPVVDLTEDDDSDLETIAYSESQPVALVKNQEIV